MGSVSVRQDLPGTSTRVSLRHEADRRGLSSPFSLRRMLLGLRPDAVIWRGFKHRWEYNHRLNRFGSYVRLRDRGGWVVGHTAASGSGPDTAHVEEFYSVLKSPHVLAKPGVERFSVEIEKGVIYAIDTDVEVLLDAAFADKNRYAVLLNGFDLWASDGADAHKMMAFALSIGEPRISGDGQHLTFNLDGSFRGHCATPECKGYPANLDRHKVRYELEVYYLLLAGDGPGFNVVRPAGGATNQYAWSSPHGEIHRQLGRVDFEIPLNGTWDGSDVVTVPGLHEIAIDLEKTGGHVATSTGPAMHLLGWDVAITAVRLGSDSVIADLLLFFKNWAQGMKAANPPKSELSLKDAGRVRLEAGVTLLQAKDGEHDASQAPTTITWDANAPASSEEARKERDIRRWRRSDQMGQLTVLTLGDSVAWGQGLRRDQKFNRLAASKIGSMLGIPSERIEVRQQAHSGAVVREPGTKPRLDPTQDHMWPEVPWGTPTVFQQAAGEPDLDVDLVLLTAGINDIGFPTILDPGGTRADLDRVMRKNCYFDMKQLLERIRQRLPEAVIIVAGYYPLLSEYSDPEVARIFITVLGRAVESIAEVALVSKAIGERVARRVRFFARRQLYWLRLAVMEKHGDPATRGPGILFAHPALGPQHSVGASHSLLFSPQSPDSLQGWWQRFKDRPLAEILQIEPDDPMADERRDACAAYRDQQGLFGEVKCRVAAIGHPNPAGARRYAKAIASVWRRNHRISLRDDLEKLDNTRGGISLRGSLRRYGLDDEPLSVRDAWQHMTVDSLAVEIATHDEAFAGTNHDVHLQVAPGRKWPLNEKVYDGDLFDDFRRGAITTYTLDPAEGDPDKRLHLGDIKELSLLLQQVASLPAGPWRPDWLRLEVNGREVHRQGIDRKLQVSITDPTDKWTADYPS